MKELSDAELFAKGIAKLESGKSKLSDTLAITNEARRRAKERKDFGNYQKLAAVASSLYTALAGAEKACADSFDLQNDQIQPRTGGGGK